MIVLGIVGGIYLQWGIITGLKNYQVIKTYILKNMYTQDKALTKNLIIIVTIKLTSTIISYIVQLLINNTIIITIYCTVTK